MAKSSDYVKAPLKTPPKMDEKHVAGRRAGVQGTYGSKAHATRHFKDVAEGTVVPPNDSSDGGGEPETARVATSLYQDAVKNRGDKIGDRALTER
jgi:hypothetical protein